MHKTRRSTPAVILHIGLHKTGTRFLKRLVFAELDSRQFNHNPEGLWRALRRAVREPGNEALADQAREQIRAWRASGDQRTLLLSEPHISGDMYGSHYDYPDNLALVQELFPEATVIYVVRRQSDWLHSAYRQQLVKGVGVPMEVFLNWYDGAFRPRVARWVYGARNVEALTLRMLDIYRDFAAAYGARNVYLFRQEDLRGRTAEVQARLAEALGIDSLPASTRRLSQNRSYSALGISLFYPSVRRHYPRPTEKDIYAGNPRVKRLTRPFRRFRRTFIQHVFDRVIYKDWDLLAQHGMRRIIDDHYARENAELEHIARLILERGTAAVEEDTRSPSGERLKTEER